MPPSTTAAVPLLSQSSSPLLLEPQSQEAQLPKKYANDPYTYLAPRVSGSRIRRYATPPSHLRVTIPDRNTKLFERSHRRLPSETTITAPPRVLARSISELVGEDEGEEQISLPIDVRSHRSIFNNVQAAETNVHEIGRLGW